MKELKLETLVKVYAVEELPEAYRSLSEAAVRAAKDAYAPYSRFYVGAAALLANGEVVAGSNQENAAYPSGLCAERVTLFYAGARYPGVPVQALAVCAFSQDRQVEQVAPCGACRQVMLESETRSGCPMKILLCGSRHISVIESVGSLLPLSFDGSDLPE